MPPKSVLYQQSPEYHVKLINDAAWRHIAAQIDPDGMILVDRMVRAGSPEGIATEQWLVSIRNEQARRVEAIEAGTEEFSPAMLDFSALGDKPYTIKELRAAAGL